MSILMKIRPLGAELFHADRHADGRATKENRHEETVAFCKFAKAPKNVHVDNFVCHVIPCNLTDGTDVSE